MTGAARRSRVNGATRFILDRRDLSRIAPACKASIRISKVRRSKRRRNSTETINSDTRMVKLLRPYAEKLLELTNDRIEELDKKRATTDSSRTYALSLLHREFSRAYLVRLYLEVPLQSNPNDVFVSFRMTNPAFRALRDIVGEWIANAKPVLKPAFKLYVESELRLDVDKILTEGDPVYYRDM